MKVCDILMKQGCVEEESIEKALKIQSENKKELEEILVEIGAVKKSDVSEALTFKSGLDDDLNSDKLSFLRSIDPFYELDSAAIEEIGNTMVWKQFSPGDMILREGNSVDTFYILKNGLAKLYMTKDGREKVIGFIGEGDFCGATALLSNGINPSSAAAIEQTLCLAQNGKDFALMIQKHPGFAGFFNQLIIHQTKKIFTKLLTSGPETIVHIEPFLYSKRVIDIVSSGQVFCSTADTIQQAGEKMITKDVNTAIVINENKKILGTVDIKELLKAILIEKNDPHMNIASILKREYTVISPDSFFFDALHLMMNKAADTLIVANDTHVNGVLTSLDLLQFRGREVLSLLRNIENAESYNELNLLRQDVENVLKALIADGALASHACKIISELNDKMVCRAVILSEKSIGSPPLPYAWLGLGSEGRKEQTLITDQDNAILYDDRGSGINIDSAKDYFEALSDKIVHGLDLCGFPLCKGNIMATNPKYFGSLSVWEKKADEWININAAKGKDLVDIYTFLDFRAVYGDGQLEKNLKKYVISLFRDNFPALRSLAEPIISVPIPLGFFKNFIVEKNGKYKNTVNIKVNGLLPLTTCIKLLAFYSGVEEANTLERIKKLEEKNILTHDRAENLELAFETFLTLKIRNNLSSAEQGNDPSNNIDPKSLGIKQKQVLKDAFMSVSELQRITKETLKVVEQ